MTQLSQELQERALGLIEVFATGRQTSDTFREARALWVEMPKMVDPDLIEARKIAAIEWPCFAEKIMDGGWDDQRPVRIARECIKRGRELQKAGS